MMADDAAGGRAQQAMMTGIVSGDAADHRAFDAALGVGGDGRDGNGQHHRQACKN